MHHALDRRACTGGEQRRWAPPVHRRRRVMAAVLQHAGAIDDGIRLPKVHDPIVGALKRAHVCCHPAQPVALNSHPPPDGAQFVPLGEEAGGDGSAYQTGGAYYDDAHVLTPEALVGGPAALTEGCCTEWPLPRAMKRPHADRAHGRAPAASRYRARWGMPASAWRTLSARQQGLSVAACDPAARGATAAPCAASPAEVC